MRSPSLIALRLSHSFYGRRLPPVLLDEIAAEDPERVLHSIPKQTKYWTAFRDSATQKLQMLLILVIIG